MKEYDYEVKKFKEKELLANEPKNGQDTKNTNRDRGTKQDRN